MQATLTVCYNDRTKHITVWNSWGESFGSMDDFCMPYEYISDLNEPLTLRFLDDLRKCENIHSPKPQARPWHDIWMDCMLGHLNYLFQVWFIFVVEAALFALLLICSTISKVHSLFYCDNICGPHCQSQ